MRPVCMTRWLAAGCRNCGGSFGICRSARRAGWSACCRTRTTRWSLAARRSVLPLTVALLLLPARLFGTRLVLRCSRSDHGEGDATAGFVDFHDPDFDDI